MDKKTLQKIDIKDKKILFELSLNPRASFSEISKRVKLPVGTISYRINTLKKKGIYNGAYIDVNPKVFGYRKYIILIKFKGTSDLQKRGYIENVKSISNIISIMECGGKWDSIFTIITQTLDELYDCLCEIKNKLKPNIIDFVLNPVLNEKFIHFGFFRNEKHDTYILDRLREKDKNYINKLTKINHKLINKINIDKIDIEIITELEQDASISIARLSYKIGLSYNAISNRMKRLHQMNVFTSIFPLIKNIPLGLEWHNLFLDIDFPDEKKEKEFLTYIITHPYIMYYMKLIGTYNYKITILSKNTMHLNEILIDIRNRFADYIEEYESILVFHYHYSIFITDIIKKEESFK